MKITTEQAFFIVTSQSGELAINLPEEIQGRLKDAFGDRIRSAGPFGQKVLTISYAPQSERRLEYTNERESISDLLAPKFRDLHLGLHPAHDWFALVQRHREVVKKDYMLIQLRDLSCSTRLVISELAPSLQTLTFRVVRAFAPILLAFSASSPVWRNVDTGFASYRGILLRQRPFSGTFPLELLRETHSSGLPRDGQSHFWDVQFKQTTGKVESIICDSFVYEESLIALINLLSRLLTKCSEEEGWFFDRFSEINYCY